MKKIFGLSCFLFLSFKLLAQDDEYQRLTKERDELIVEYNYLNAQNSNFWGKKSKKDLLKIVDNLKAIIKKDTELLNNVQASYVKRNADLTAKTEKLQSERQADTHKIKEVKAAKTEHDMITVLASVVALFLLIYIIKLRGKLAKKNGR